MSFLPLNSNSSSACYLACLQVMNLKCHSVTLRVHVDVTDLTAVKALSLLPDGN